MLDFFGMSLKNESMANPSRLGKRAPNPKAQRAFKRFGHGPDRDTLEGDG
jgi:hypothetical protein